MLGASELKNRALTVFETHMTKLRAGIRRQTSRQSLVVTFLFSVSSTVGRPTPVDSSMFNVISTRGEADHCSSCVSLEGPTDGQCCDVAARDAHMHVSQK